MINVEVNNKSVISFDNIEDFYKWIVTFKGDVLSIADENARNLYNFLKSYKMIKKEFENNIDITNNNFHGAEENNLVKTATNELIRMNSDGKYLRGFLIALGYNTFCKKRNNKYLNLALAYETFQTSILIHDDIIDNAILRRGKITIPKKYCDEFDLYDKKTNDFETDKKHIADSLGICIGDLGFYLANKIIVDNYSNEKAFADVLKLYNEIVINTINGEIIDVILPFNEQYNSKSNSSTTDVMEIYKLKTAWYSIIGPYLLGMTLACVDDEKKNVMKDILYNLGIAFQIKDDILGIFGDESLVGKTSSDISEFKQTILYTYLKNDKERFNELNKYYGKNNLSDDEIEIVKKIFIDSGAYNYSVNNMKDLFEKSRLELKKIDFIDEEYKNILLGFIYYLDFRTK